MYLKRLELQGFKSFANKTELDFKPGITVVIGPNGSGKSNLSDAIRWVLGEQSMKALRSGKSDDVIFAGTQSRKSLGFAEVSIVFDNSDGTLPIEFTEVTISRRIYRTGETGYFINKVACRLKDILELLMDTGIGKDGYSIIGQGKVDEILSTKSEDRRHIFEEAAGIIKFRTRRAETEKKLEQTKVNLIRINDILTEIENNLEPLRIQAEKAKQFVELREELKNIEVGLYLYKIDSFREKLEKLEKDKEIFEAQNKEEEEKLVKMQELKEKLRAEIEQLDLEIERIQNLSFESKNEIEKINSNINISNERISNNEETKHRLEQEISESTELIKSLEEDKKNRETRREDLLRNKERFVNELKEKENELAEINKKLSDKQKEIEDKKKQNDDIIDKRYNLQNSITMYDTNYENIEDRKKQAEKDLAKSISELDSKRDDRSKINQNVLDIENQRNKNKDELDKVQIQKDKIEQKTKEFDQQIENLTDSKRMKTQKHDFLVETEKEREGYAKSVKDLLDAADTNSELKKGNNGVLADIISTDDQYQTAIEMALGAAMQNIVTDTEQDAKRMVEYLRKNNLGRATFLPITTVKGKKLDNYTSQEGVIGVASDLVKTNEKYEGVILNLLGRTLIVDNIENAIKVAKTNKYSFKIVTLEGDVLNSSGAMTGGSVQKKNFNLLGRGHQIKKLEKEIAEIDKKLEKTVTSKEEYLKDNELVIQQIVELSEKLQQSEVALAAIKEKLAAQDNEIAKINEGKEKLQADIENYKKQMEEQVSEKQKVQTEITALTEESNKLLDEIKEFAELNKDDQEVLDNLNEDITDLKISVSSFDESNNSIDEMMERIDQDIKSEQEKIEENKQGIEKSIEQNKELAETIKELQANIERIQKEVENSGNKTEELKESRVKKNEDLVKSEEDITKQFETIQKVKEGLVKADSKYTSMNQDLLEIINDLWADYEITPNNAAEQYSKPENIVETQKHSDKLHAQIKALGDVNVAAIDEYKNTKERYETMSTQRYDLETTIAKLRDIITEMTDKMKEQFVKKFEQIEKNFQVVFAELFGGGNASLMLEDKENVLECGIEIKVQPPGKKLQNMLQLSGGERALTAIALLFAILKLNPAPFCILDEIEAALDDVNVYRFAEYLKKFSSETQFLVITHRKGTMEAADTVYGITMEENGISKLLSIDLKGK